MSILHVPQTVHGYIHQHCEDGDVDTTISQLCEYASWAQLADEDLIEVVSADAADTTQKVTVVGIDNAGRRVIEEISLNGTTAVDSSTTFRYIENAYLDKECAGAVTVRKNTGATGINQIAIGVLSADVIHAFPGDDHVLEVREWWGGLDLASAAGANYGRFELRWYPDDADCLDTGDGYRVMDQVSVDADDTGSSPARFHRTFQSPLRIPEGGWVAVWALGEADNKIGYGGMVFNPRRTKHIDNPQT